MAHATYYEPTLERIAEQIYLQYSGTSLTSDSYKSIEEIKYLVVQQINRLLKVERLQETNLNDYRLPDNALITNYTVTNITADGERSFFKLPIMPIAAPHGMGLYEVILEDTVDNIEYELVPIDNAYYRTFMALYPNWNQYYAFSNSFGGATGGWYKWDGGIKVYLASSDFASNHRVKIKLLAIDIATLNENDLLPIPADMEATVIEQVLNLMRARLPQDKAQDDNTSR